MKSEDVDLIALDQRLADLKRELSEARRKIAFYEEVSVSNKKAAERDYNANEALRQQCALATQDAEALRSQLGHAKAHGQRHDGFEVHIYGDSEFSQMHRVKTRAEAVTLMRRTEGRIPAESVVITRVSIDSVYRQGTLLYSVGGEQ